MNDTYIDLSIELYDTEIETMDVWQRLRTYLEAADKPPEKIALFGSKRLYKLNTIEKKLKYKRRFEAQWESIYFSLNRFEGDNFTRISGGYSIGDGGGFPDKEEAERFLSFFINMPEFKKATLYHTNYWSRQNGEDP